MRCLLAFPGIRILAFSHGLISLLFAPLFAQSSNSPAPSVTLPDGPVTARGGMVATQEAHATRAALKVLAEGGNAVDAAVTAGFTLAVTLPRAGNLGGGGFMLIHLAEENRQIALDYREKAPSAAKRDMFLTKGGAPDPRLSRYTRLASGVPGTVRGLAHALRHYGSISIRRALAPAIKLAEDGFVVGQALHDSLKSCANDLYADKEARSIFLNANGKAWPVGSTLVQKDLARSLRLLSEQGPAAFPTYIAKAKCNSDAIHAFCSGLDLSLAIEAFTPSLTFSRIITPVFVFIDCVLRTCDCQGCGRRAAAWLASSLVLGFHSAPAPTEVAASSITSKHNWTHRADESNSGSFPSFAACALSR